MSTIAPGSVVVPIVDHLMIMTQPRTLSWHLWVSDAEYLMLLVIAVVFTAHVLPWVFVTSSSVTGWVYYGAIARVEDP